MAIHHEYPAGCDSPEDRRKYRKAVRDGLKKTGEYVGSSTPREKAPRKTASSVYAESLMRKMGNGPKDPLEMGKKLELMGLLMKGSLEESTIPYVFSLEDGPSPEQLISKFEKRWNKKPEWYHLQFGGHNIGLGPIN